MPDDETALVFWRNLITQWHLDQGLPDCGCDDDTADGDFCPESQAWADERYADRPDSRLEGEPDRWDHDIWVAAWGYNATTVVGDNDFRLPKTPEGTAWLLTRLLVRGRKAMELALIRFGEHRMATVAHGRVEPEPTTVAAKARRILQGLGD